MNFYTFSGMMLQAVILAIGVIIGLDLRESSQLSLLLRQLWS
jgi:hypothetical protein